MSSKPENANIPKLDLIYFPMRARGDVFRRILIDAQLPFTETVVQWDSTWEGGKKSEFRFGQLPVLSVDNGRAVIAQSFAIARYAAQLVDPGLLSPDGTPEAAADVDMWYLQAEDVYAEFIPPFYMAPDTVDKFVSERWPGWIAPFEGALASGARKFLAGGGGRVTIADYKIMDVLDLAFLCDSDGRLGLRAAAPAVSAYHDRFVELPGSRRFAEYVKDLRFTLSGKY